MPMEISTPNVPLTRLERWGVGTLAATTAAIVLATIFQGEDNRSGAIDLVALAGMGIGSGMLIRADHKKKGLVESTYQD